MIVGEQKFGYNNNKLSPTIIILVQIARRQRHKLKYKYVYTLQIKFSSHTFKHNAKYM